MIYDQRDMQETLPASTPEAAILHEPGIDAFVQPSPIEQRPRRTFGRFRATVHFLATVTCGTSLGAWAIEPDTIQTERPAATVDADLADNQLPTQQEYCPNTNAASITAVSTVLFGNPKTGTEPLTMKPQGFRAFNLAEVATATTRGEPFEDEIWRHELAQKYGLTMHSARPYIARMQTVDNYAPVTPEYRYQVQFNAAKEYLSQFGVSLEADAQKGDLAYGAHALTAADRKNSMTSYNLESLVRTFNTYTEEFVALSGVKRIVLVAGAEHADEDNSKLKWNTLGYYWNGNVAFDTDDYASDEVIGHEFGHGINHNTCGGATSIDPSWTMLNRNTHYGKNTTQSYDQFRAEINQLARNSFDKNREMFEKIESCDPPRMVHKMGRNIAFMSNYGGSSEGEDQAEFTARATKPQLLTRILSYPLPILKDKLVAYFARIYQYRPRVALFLMGQRYPGPCDYKSPSSPESLKLQFESSQK